VAFIQRAIDRGLADVTMIMYAFVDTKSIETYDDDQIKTVFDLIAQCKGSRGVIFNSYFATLYNNIRTQEFANKYIDGVLSNMNMRELTYIINHCEYVR
jgi:hypothetical protein